MNTIITIDEARNLGRPIGKVDDSKLLAFIVEVESTIIKRTIGDNLYLRIVNQQGYDADIDMLLQGGTYEGICGATRYVTGLKTAIAYYVYAQNVRAGDLQSTRYGMVVKDGQYSSSITPKERDIAANSATEIADAYLRECVEYCKAKGLIVSQGGSLHITSGCVIRKIKI